MTVLDEMPARRERLAVAARQGYATIAGVRYVAAHHGMTGAAFDHHAGVADIAEEATGDTIARAASYLDGVGTRGFENQTPKNDV